MRKGLSLAVVVAVLSAVACLAVPAAARATITEFAVVPGAPGGTHIPRYLEVGPEGAIWWSENGTEPGIGRITTAGLRLARIPDPNSPADLVRGGDGTVFWSGDGGIGRKTPGGPAELVARPGFSEAVGLTAAGSVRWGETDPTPAAEGVYRFAGESWAGVAQPVVTMPGGSGAVTGMALGPEGHLWVAFPGEDQLRVLDAAGATSERTLELPPGSGPDRLALGPDGNLWVTMFDADAIDRIAPDGSRVRFPLPTGSSPLDITAGPDGALWFTEYGTNRVGRITTAGAVSEYAIPTPASFPIGIVAGPDGAIWFAESEAGKIGRLAPDSTDPVPGGGDSVPGGSDAAAPRFLRPPAFRPRRFVPAVAGGGAATPRRDRRKATGTALRLDLSEPARVIVRCFRGGGRRPLGRLVGSVDAGRSRLRFSGRLHGHPLAPGRYRATILARDEAGNPAPTRVARFVVLPLPPR